MEITSLQRERLLQEIRGEFLGKEIEIVGHYTNITSEEIKLDGIIDFENGHMAGKISSSGIWISYDKGKFKALLLTYPKERIVRMVGSIVDIDNFGSFTTHIRINLLSIEDCEEEIGKQLEILKKSKDEKSCFIATACYGDCYALEVLLFRRYRDEKLLKTSLGRSFVRFYYFTSPRLADLIAESEPLKNFVRKCILHPLLVRIERRLK